MLQEVEAALGLAGWVAGDADQASLVLNLIAADEPRPALIRRAVDEYLDTDADEELRFARFMAAVDAVAGAAPDFPQESLYVERLRALDVSRQEEIERRRRA